MNNLGKFIKVIYQIKILKQSQTCKEVQVVKCYKKKYH